jgi:hypothetical protein
VASARVTYRSRPDATPEAEPSALSACYAFILQKHQEKKKGGPETPPDDAEKESKNDRARNIISE